MKGVNLTPYQRIVRAALRGTGLRLTAKEVEYLWMDDAICTVAANDDEEQQATRRHKEERSVK